MEFEHNGKKYDFFNAMEEIVLEKVRAIMNGFDMCKCAKCYYDVCAIVLNNLGAPHYVTSNEGALMNKALLMNSETLTNVSIEIYKALTLVQKKPKH